MKLDVYKCFIPECYLDTALVEVLLNRGNAVTHSKGNSSVIAKMNKMLDSFAVGIIDQDKVVLKDLAQFKIEERLSKQYLKLFKHPKRQHYIIQICPAIEEWIINQCEKGNIIPSDHGLPNDKKGMVKMKDITQRNDIRFKKLFKEMSINNNCDEIQEMLRWLTFFKDHNYQTNLDLL